MPVLDAAIDFEFVGDVDVQADTERVRVGDDDCEPLIDSLGLRESLVDFDDFSDIVRDCTGLCDDRVDKDGLDDADGEREDDGDKDISGVTVRAASAVRETEGLCETDLLDAPVAVNDS